MSSILPQVSLISSWFIDAGAKTHRLSPPTPPMSLVHALRQRVGLLDLYFLDRADIPWYQNKAQIPGSFETALDFVAALNQKNLKRIRDALIDLMTNEYQGPLVGPRPRFAALATYWPLISLPPQEDKSGPKAKTFRAKSIRAVQNSLYLAALLGCHCVEIVGGSALPEGKQQKQSVRVPDDYRKDRMNCLAQSLIDAITDDWAEQLFEDSRMPFLAIEIEPGTSFLINTVGRYRELRRSLGRSPKTRQRVLLNVDVAHLMLIQDTGDEPGLKGKKIIDRIRRMRRQVAHIHLSDHARSHASDLTPGTYHFYSDYADWLQLAIQLAQNPSHRANSFSGVIAIELEACNDIHEAVRAMGKVSRWLDQAAKTMPPATHPNPQNDNPPPTPDPGGFKKGAILAVDLGNSTSGILSRGNRGEWALAEEISALCRIVHREQGSVLSFTGDGLIAFFDEQHFLHRLADAATHAMNAARAMESSIDRKTNQHAPNDEPVTLRAALHCGNVLIPTAGHLRHQAIGKDVVVTTRLCDLIAKEIEISVPKNRRGAIIAFTSELRPFLPKPVPGDFVFWKKVTLKGIFKPKTVYVDKRYVPSGRATRP